MTGRLCIYFFLIHEWKPQVHSSFALTTNFLNEAFSLKRENQGLSKHGRRTALSVYSVYTLYLSIKKVHAVLSDAN